MKRYLLKMCFYFTYRHLNKWYEDHQTGMTQEAWKKNFEAVHYLKKFIKNNL